MSNRRIWIVTELFYPEETAVAYIFTRIANYLSNTYDINVICGPEFYDKKKKEFVDCIRISENIKIFRVKSFNFDKNSLLQRSLNIMFLTLRLGILMWRNISKGETVILSTNPAPLLLLVKVFKRVKKCKVHILVHDVFPENTIPARVFKNNKTAAYKLLKYFFDRAYSSADHLIVIGRDMKKIIQVKVSKFKSQPHISIITNWSNTEHQPISLDPTPKIKSLTLQYAGNLGRVQGLMELLSAFKQSKNESVLLKFQGCGALYSYIENYIRENKLLNVELKGSFSRRDESRILADCDIGIVSLSSGMFGLGVPSKAYQLLSAGKPILYIGEPDTEIYTMIKENGVGWSLDIRNQTELIEFFKNLNSISINNIKSMGKIARSLAEADYNEKTILRLLQSRIEAVNNLNCSNRK